MRSHPVYAAVVTIDDLRAFMEHHVWAVWDFMNLVKAIQRRYTSTVIPWTPRGDATVRRFVNEIVLEEESDTHPVTDGFCSHFELYVRSMAEVGARTDEVSRFVDSLEAGVAFEDALAHSGCAPAVSHFLTITWDAARASDEELVAAFAFGRETVIPVMFERILAEAGSLEHAELLQHYLVRHVELDGDSHGHMAEYLLASACGDDPQRWDRAEASARSCLEARARLWDAVGDRVTGNRLN
ncbi:MAG: DUF3050 domain-containing protein [Acidimicrobiales bacterium]